MKKSGVLAATVAAASATAASAASCSSSYDFDSKIQLSLEEPKGNRVNNSSVSTDKFAPRFDGLRFIETLVTAHR